MAFPSAPPLWSPYSPSVVLRGACWAGKELSCPSPKHRGGKAEDFIWTGNATLTRMKKPLVSELAGCCMYPPTTSVGGLQRSWRVDEACASGLTNTESCPELLQLASSTGGSRRKLLKSSASLATTRRGACRSGNTSPLGTVESGMAEEVALTAHGRRRNGMASPASEIFVDELKAPQRSPLRGSRSMSSWRGLMTEPGYGERDVSPSVHLSCVSQKLDVLPRALVVDQESPGGSSRPIDVTSAGINSLLDTDAQRQLRFVDSPGAAMEAIGGEPGGLSRLGFLASQAPEQWCRAQRRPNTLGTLYNRRMYASRLPE
eukprot:TRINITY_DN9519_c0_g1_i1.p1 TRINITY_DN9519_c0_g1~~TRINITY_DN9519_c0_g1_i1.p1  ORF type:complete len:317 (-),score=40.33 TRINITY_DN9519_c0_g1_i1:597-1547(-)